MGFSIKKDKSKKSEKLDDCSTILSSVSRRFRRKTKKKKKKKRAGLEESDVEDERMMTGAKAEPRHARSSSFADEEGIEQVLGAEQEKDWIERHRDGYEDTIENHRDEFEDDQTLNLQLHDWYEQESMAADLESLKRKPWYQKQKELEESGGGEVEDTRFTKVAFSDNQVIKTGLGHRKTQKDEQTIESGTAEADEDSEEEEETQEETRGDDFCSKSTAKDSWREDIKERDFRFSPCSEVVGKVALDREMDHQSRMVNIRGMPASLGNAERDGFGGNESAKGEHVTRKIPTRALPACMYNKDRKEEPCKFAPHCGGATGQEEKLVPVPLSPKTREEARDQRNEPLMTAKIPIGFRTRDENGQEYEFVPVGRPHKDTQRNEEKQQQSKEAGSTFPDVFNTKDATRGKEYESFPAGGAFNSANTNATRGQEHKATREEEYESVPAGRAFNSANMNGTKGQEHIAAHDDAPISFRDATEENPLELLDEEYEFVHQNGIPIGFRTRQVIEDEVERLDYARRSLARLKRIEELRKSREEMKLKLEEKKRRRRAKKDRAQRKKKIEKETRRVQKEYSRRKKLPEFPPPAPNDISVLTDPHMVLVDLTDVCSRRDTLRMDRRPIDPPTTRWVSATKREIPVIVDLTDRRKPQQILDLTKMKDAASIASQERAPQKVASSPRKSRLQDWSPPRTHRIETSPPRTRHTHSLLDQHLTVAPPTPNHRLEVLRRERAEKLNDMTHKFHKVKNKDVRTRAREKKIEIKPSAYQKMMERVTNNVQTPYYGV